jgi:hypothetical protein
VESPLQSVVLASKIGLHPEQVTLAVLDVARPTDDRDVQPERRVGAVVLEAASSFREAPRFSAPCR